MIYKVNEEGVAALNSLASTLTEAISELKGTSGATQAAFEENSVGLGPHDTSIKAILEDMHDTLGRITDPVSDLAEKVANQAKTYQEIIDDDLYGK